MELPLALLTPPTATNANNNPASTSTSPPTGTSAIPVVAVKKDTKKKHHLTTATDPLFAELRDLNFSSVGKKLNKVARRLDEDYKVYFRRELVELVLTTIFNRQIFRRRRLLNYAISLANSEVSRRSTKP